MSKARMLGIKSSYIPNAKADMRFKRNLYQRGREIAERDIKETRAACRERRELERMKYENNHSNH